MLTEFSPKPVPSFSEVVITVVDGVICRRRRGSSEFQVRADLAQVDAETGRVARKPARFILGRSDPAPEFLNTEESCRRQQ